MDVHAIKSDIAVQSGKTFRGRDGVQMVADEGAIALNAGAQVRVLDDYSNFDFARFIRVRFEFGKKIENICSAKF